MAISRASRGLLHVLFLLLASHEAGAFVVRSSSLPEVSIPPRGHGKNGFDASSLISNTSARRCSQRVSSSALKMNLIGSSVGVLNKTPVRKILLALGTALLVVVSKLYKRIFWPGSSPDPNLSEPLPEGSFGCPFFGNNVMGGTREYGPYVFLDRAAKKLGNPNLFKFYAFGSPMVSVRGKENIQAVLADEFDTEGVNTHMVSDSWATLFGDQSILYETDKEKHGLLRRLAGAAMTPAAITQAVPAIQAAANDQVDSMLQEQSAGAKKVKMEQVAYTFTLDVAWRQILGLDLKQDEVAVFRQAVKDWIAGMSNPLLLLPIPRALLKTFKSYRAREYLVSKVEDKLNQFYFTGPDGSTLSGVYFATDDDNKSKLTRKQVIDNALILIVAGSETSASTLTVAMLLLGLHPDVWNKLKKEQEAMHKKHGDTITKKALDDDCPNLDAVIKETLRIRPIPSTEIRQTRKTLIVNGKQIPKNWMLWLNIRATHDNDPATYRKDGQHMDLQYGFQPDRWLTTTAIATDGPAKPTEWMPFGEGARRCLGERLAMTEMKVFLATMARRLDFDLVSADKKKIQWRRMSVMPRPLDGVEVIPRADPSFATA